MINFGANDTLYKLRSNALGAGISNATIPFGNSADSNCQTPVITSTAAECNEASGRCQVQMNSQKSKQQSVEQYVDNLRKQGKIEGKDFKIGGAIDYGNYNLYEYDAQGREIKTNYWCNGNQAFNHGDYMTSEYKNGVRIDKSYRIDGEPFCVNEKYPNVREEDLEESKLRDTSVEDYCKYLQSQGKVENKDYKVERETVERAKGDCYEQIFVDEFSPSGVRQKTLWWIIEKDGCNLTISYRNEEGKELIRHSYNADNTSERTFYYKNLEH